MPFAAGGARPAGDDEGGLARRARAAARGEGAGAAAGESARKSAAPALHLRRPAEPQLRQEARRQQVGRRRARHSGEWPSVSLTAFFQNPAGAGAAAALGEPGPEGGAELAMSDIVAAESESSTASTIFGASPTAARGWRTPAPASPAPAAARPPARPPW